MSYQYIYGKDGVLSAAIFPEVAGFGIQIPANGVELDNELIDKDGYVWVWKDNQLIQVKDNRGTYYSKKTGEQVEYIEYGDLPDTLTKKVPSSQYDKWDGKKWVKDERAEIDDLKSQALTKKDSLLSMAYEKIIPLQDAVDIEEATEDELTKLKEWKKYRVLLNRIESQPNFPNNIDWPKIPNN